VSDQTRLKNGSRPKLKGGESAMIRFDKCVPLTAVLLGLSVLGLVTPTARAGLLPTLTLNPPMSDGMGNFIYNYNVQLPSHFQVKSGDSFTIYDFQGYVDGSATVPFAGWSATVTTDTPPVGLSHSDVTDDPTVPDIRYTYTGPTIVGEQFMVFTATSTSGIVWNPPDTIKNVASAIHNQSGGQANEVTNTDVPMVKNNPNPQAPEPATLAMLGIGMPLLGAFNLLRRRKVHGTK